MRKLYLSCDINEESFKEFCQQLDEYDAVKPRREVEVVLNSIGGNALDAIAFMGRMRLSPNPITVTVFGLAGSAAVLILAAGDHRRISKESWVMVHEDTGTYKGIKTSDLEKEAAMARKFEDQWNSLLEELTDTKKEVWNDLHKRGDLYLTPEECLKLGIVDEII